MPLRSLGHRAPLLWLVLPYAVGLAVSKTAHGLPPSICLFVAAAGLLIAGAAWQSRRVWAIALLTAMVAAGAASYTLHRARLPDWTNLPPREARLGLQVEYAFARVYENRSTGLATVIRADPHLQDLLGQRVYFSLRDAAEGATALRSAQLETIGVLELLPENPPKNTFEGYLASAGMNFTLTRGAILTVTRPPTAFREFCDAMAGKFALMLETGTAGKRPELTGVFRAMLLGQKDELNEEQDSLFMRSGTMHLFAISGLHIGVIAAGIHAFLSLLRVPRLPKLVIGLTLLWLYVQITGGTPSAVRAFTMVALFQLTLQLRLPGNPVSALATAALLVLMVDPLQLFSASFQMSYGIVASLLLYGLPLGETWLARWPPFPRLPQNTWRWWHWRIAALWRWFLTIVAIGVASIIFSVVAGVEYFGLFTPGALLANLVLVPTAMIVILAGMGSLICGLTGFALGSALCNHAALLLLWLMDEGIRRFVTVPGVYHVAMFKAEWIGPVVFAILLGALLWGYLRRWQGLRATWWLPPGIVVVALIFGVNFV
ncbi:MAG: ComEC/Rec2 family competence protein [Opitutaceae bacterium]|nr:ComEC/Rec2 family competence protein [Cephaloticoccus sp.]MCP5529734.1 ComEC/Rec2 family competence protein [Opitutaceae bacterium]